MSSLPGLGKLTDYIDRRVSMAHEYTEAALYDAICRGELSHTGYFYVVNSWRGDYTSVTETYNAETGKLITSIDVNIITGKLKNNRTGEEY